MTSTTLGTPFKKVLIANRGEIACRIIRSVHKLGYSSVAVYSEADANAAHVRMANEAVCIGAAPASESYLNIAAILAAAEKTGADAVHPGYGFLSENAAFNRACVAAGLVFIGPSAEAIEAMGDKAVAKRRMISAGVPTVPGYQDEQQSDARLIKEADSVGFPLLVKAVAGGGGRGMRLVYQHSELAEAIISARRESASAFGDDRLMLERLIEFGRHIEIQIFADAHGNAVHLGERDCTAQRRRQKVIEEAPSPIVDSTIREAMGNDAVAAALAVNYCGAGTVEFIVDQSGKHFFLEMNTRLQVEHPVTEMITGYDLVEWQLLVAEGKKIPVHQHQIQFNGHAIEARLYAEDPYQGFAPQTGRILYWRPETNLVNGLRVDDGILEQGLVSPFYDPMLAKLIVHGTDRDDAIRRLAKLLANTPLFGLRNNSRFLHDLIQHPVFRNAQMDTAMLDRWLDEGEPIMQAPAAPSIAWVLAAALFAGQPCWRSASVAEFELSLHCDDGSSNKLRIRKTPDAVHVMHNQNSFCVRILSAHNNCLHYEIDGLQAHLIFQQEAKQVYLALQASVFVFSESNPLELFDDVEKSGHLVASLAGRVTQIAVAVGDEVLVGQALICLEAMKMEIWVKARTAGRVRSIHTQLNNQVEANALLIEFDDFSTEA